VPQSASNESFVGRYGSYIWPLRVPILSAVVLLGLPWFAFWPGVATLLAGLFDPLTEAALLLITVVALFIAWTITLTGRLVLAYGEARLGLPPLKWEFFPVSHWVWPASALLALPMVATVIRYASTASGRRTPAMLGYCAGGIVLAGVSLWVTLAVSGWFEQKVATLRRRSAGSLWGRAYLTLLATLSKRPWLSAGLIKVDPRRGPVLERGHGLALVLGAASLLLFVATGFLTRDIHRPNLAATLTYALLLLLSVTWVAGFVAFFIDRSRVPLAIFVLGWIVIVDQVIDRVFPTDHIYRTVALPAGALPRPEPTQLLSGANTGIVVAASGGGIQAAAWTAHVLGGLQRSVSDFDARLRLISAVSGGSVGAMNFLASVAPCGPALAPAAATFDPDRASQESSLHAVGWGLVFKDLPRTIAPFFSNPYVDRGSVLEDAWKREPRLQASLPSTAALLSSWRRNVAERQCPGVVYNAMAAETGEPFLFSTVALPPDLRHFDFYERYVDRDVPVTTAVRLSAGFPYVSPATRADGDDLTARYIHVVDGGYYDNYGVSTLVAWLQVALSGSLPAAPVKRWLVIEICDTAQCSSAAPPPLSSGGPRRAWPYQILAPLTGLLATRFTAQQVTNRNSLGLLQTYWEQHRVCIESIAVPFSGEPGPLSWHLTETQKRAIAGTWAAKEASMADAVRTFLAGGRASGAQNAACVPGTP
jgi:Patatin-like phospholipase